MKILVIGGAGMLGHQCFLKAKAAFGSDNVGCTLRKNREHYDKYGVFSQGNIFDKIDVGTFSSLKEVLETFKPTVIVNCVGLTLRKPELGDFNQALDINAMLPHKLALWGLENGARVIHFSTDCVFDGSLGGYSEASLPNAKDVYGKTKFLGEIIYPNSLTLRLSIVGRELEGKTELIEWFLAQKNKKIRGFCEVMYSGLTTNVVADEVIKAIKYFPNLTGVYQLSSIPTSKFDLLNITNQIYENNTTIDKDSSYKSNKVLRCDRYQKATGFKQPDWPTMIRQMKEEESINYGK